MEYSQPEDRYAVDYIAIFYFGLVLSNEGDEKIFERVAAHRERCL
jgi:hypothetical protein